MIRALMVNGPLRGQVVEMPRGGYLNIERTKVGSDPFGLLDEYTQVLYTPRRIGLFGHIVWVAASDWTQDHYEELWDLLVSDLGKGLDT